MQYNKKTDDDFFNFDDEPSIEEEINSINKNVSIRLMETVNNSPSFYYVSKYGDKTNILWELLNHLQESLLIEIDTILKNHDFNHSNFIIEQIDLFFQNDKIFRENNSFVEDIQKFWLISKYESTLEGQRLSEIKSNIISDITFKKFEDLYQDNIAQLLDSIYNMIVILLKTYEEILLFDDFSIYVEFITKNINSFIKNISEK